LGPLHKLLNEGCYVKTDVEADGLAALHRGGSDGMQRKRLEIVDVVRAIKTMTVS
jgi:hypothetical protein